jgi:NAD(P)-dependent dehydrogenase (short-subunit alcohol dehydrogenase family)
VESSRSSRPPGGRLAEKVILIVGATSGIGRATALRAAEEGAAVVVAGRRADLGHVVVDQITRRGGRAVFVTCDATVEAEMAAAVHTTVVAFGRLDGAVNNAGGVHAAGPVCQVTAADWQAELDVNLTTVFYGVKHQIPVIAEAGGGAVINNASTAGLIAVPGLAGYSAAKHAVVGLTKSAALEWAPRGVRINAVVTGNTDTALYRRLLGATDRQPRHELAAPNPSGRLADPDEIATLFTYLLSDDARFITGAAIPIDGGATAQ